MKALGYKLTDEFPTCELCDFYQRNGGGGLCYFKPGVLDVVSNGSYCSEWRYTGLVSRSDKNMAPPDGSSHFKQRHLGERIRIVDFVEQLYVCKTTETDGWK